METLKTIRPMGMAVLFVLALCTGARVARAEAEHRPNGAIYPVSIVSPSHGDAIPYGFPIEVECSGTADPDEYRDPPGEGDWVTCYDELLYTWGGPGSFDPEEGIYSLWTVPTSVGKKTITVTASDVPLYFDADDTTHPSYPIDVYVVKVEKIQYRIGDSGNFADVPDPLHVVVSTTVKFQAIKDDGGWGVSWPQYYQKPCWGGTSGASGSGDESVNVTFETKSSDANDFKTVTAECGNSVTVNVLVHELEITEPQTAGTFTFDEQNQDEDSWLEMPHWRLVWQAVAGVEGITTGDMTLTVEAAPAHDFGDDLIWDPLSNAVGQIGDPEHPEQDPITGMSVKLHPHEAGSGEAWIYAKVFGQIGAAVELVLYPSHIARVLYTFPHGNKCAPNTMEVGPDPPNEQVTVKGSMACGQSASLCQNGYAGGKDDQDEPDTNPQLYTRVPSTGSFDLLNPSDPEQAAIDATVEGDMVQYGDDEDNPTGHWATVCNGNHQVWAANMLPKPDYLCYFEVTSILGVWNPGPEQQLTRFIIWQKN